MTEYSELKEGVYKKEFIDDEQIWHIFLRIFNSAESVKVASYKYSLIYSILKCLQANENQVKFSFKEIFIPFTRIYWKLIVHQQLFQISSNTLSFIYKILIKFIMDHPNLRNEDFEAISTDLKDF